MNPFEMIQSLLSGGGQSGVGRFAEPDLMPPTQAAPGPSWSPSKSVESAPPTMWLRSILGIKPDNPSQNPDPEGAGDLLAKRPATPMPPPGMAIASAPAPAGNQADLLAMFKDGAQQPTASVMPPRPAVGGAGPGGGAGQPLPPFQTSVQPSAQGGIMEMLGGLKNNPTASALVDILNGAMRGAAMNVNNPRGMGIGAFGAGYTNAQDYISKRDKEKSAAELAKQKLQFDQTLAVRKDSREERGSGRDDEKLKLSREEQTRKNEETKVKNRVAVDKLMQARAGTLSTEAKFKLQDQVTKYLDKLNKNGLMEAPALEAAAAKKVAELEAYYGVPRQGATAPAAGGAPVTATGPNGQKLILQGGQWVPAP